MNTQSTIQTEAVSTRLTCHHCWNDMWHLERPLGWPFPDSDLSGSGLPDPLPTVPTSLGLFRLRPDPDSDYGVDLAEQLRPIPSSLDHWTWLECANCHYSFKWGDRQLEDFDCTPIAELQGGFWGSDASYELDHILDHLSLVTDLMTGSDKNFVNRLKPVIKAVQKLREEIVEESDECVAPR